MRAKKHRDKAKSLQLHLTEEQTAFYLMGDTRDSGKYYTETSPPPYPSRQRFM